MSTIKKYDQTIIIGLIDQIKKSKKTNLKLSLKENNIIKAINSEYSHDLLGKWNGYGYERLGKHLLTTNFKETLKALRKLLKNSEIKKEKKEIDPQTKIQKWAERLAKLTNISIDEALIIAQEKIDYKIEKLYDSVNYQCSGWKIPAWQKKAQKKLDSINEDESKALDRIEDEEHGRLILVASNRHNNSNYEDKLEEARELVAMGELDRVDVQDYARREMQF
jgi:hypothetical protein